MVFVYFRNGTLDLLIADTPVLDYYRATDHGCKLQRVGDHALMEDTYAIGMAKGFPLKVKSHPQTSYVFLLKWLSGHIIHFAEFFQLITMTVGWIDYDNHYVCAPKTKNNMPSSGSL